MARQSGIYIITNTVNGNFYIGSSVHVRVRIVEHLWSLRNNRHRNKYLQSAWNKYGEECFVFAPLLYCDRSMTLYYEQTCLDKLKPEYNFAKDAKAPMLGVSFSDEHKRKIGDAHKGELSSRYGTHLSEDQKQHLSEVNKGKQFSDETRAKMREAWKLRPPISEETRLKLRESNKGKRHTEEQYRKSSEAMKGDGNPFFGKHHTEEAKRKNSEAHKDKINPMLGKHHTEEAKIKMRESWARRHDGSQQ